MAERLSSVHCWEAGPEDLQTHRSERKASIWRVPPSGELWDWWALRASLRPCYGKLVVVYHADYMTIHLALIMIYQLSNIPVTFKSGVQAENWESSGNFYDIRE